MQVFSNGLVMGLLTFLLSCGTGSGSDSVQTSPEKWLAEPGDQKILVVRGEILLEVEAPITTSPVTEAVLRSPSRGTLVSVPTVGQRVKAGEVAARLDTQTLERAVLEAQINVEESGLALEKQNQTLEGLRKTWENNQILAKSQLITEEALTNSRTNLKKEELQYKSLELNQKKALLNLEDARENRENASIRSPVTGIVSSVTEDPGTYVESNTEVFRVVDISTVTLTGQVDEYDIGKLKVGQRAEAVFEALEGQVFPSILRTVSPGAKTENNVPVYSITALVPNPEEKIRPGMSGDLTVTVLREKGLVVPKEAVSTVRRKSFVEIILNGETKTLPVETGPSDGKLILIVSGLEEGQELAYKPKARAPASNGSMTPPSAQSGESQGRNGNGSTRQNSLLGIPGSRGGQGGGPPPGGF